MISLISFAGLDVRLNENRPVLKRIIKDDVTKIAAENAFRIIDEQSGKKDVFLKASKYNPLEENPELGMNENYDLSKFVKLQITDENDEVLAEVKTYADEPKGTHTRCIASKLSKLALDFVLNPNKDIIK